MSFLKSLFSMFGGNARGGADANEGPGATEDYNGFTIRATPYLEGGQYQTAGVIEKEIDGVRKEHRFVRADRYAGREDAVTFSLAKGRQIVDQAGRMGKGLFD